MYWPATILGLGLSREKKFQSTINLLILFGFFVCGFGSNCAFAIQSLRLAPSVLSDSIPQPSITALFQDRRGLLWVGTQNGLYLYDGTQVTRFGRDLSKRRYIPETDIRGVGGGLDGQVFAATFGSGLLAWNDLSQSFERYIIPGSEAVSHVERLHVTRNSTIWISTKNEVIRHVPHTTNVVVKSRLDLGMIGRPRAFASVNDSLIYIGGNDGIVRWDAERDVLSEVTHIESHAGGLKGITALHLLASGLLAAGTNDGRVYFIDTVLHKVTREFDIGNEKRSLISDFAETDEALFIATDRGLHGLELPLADSTAPSFIDLPLANTDIHVLLDTENALLIGTYNSLDVAKPMQMRHTKSFGSEPYADVLSFAEDSFKNVWIGSYSGLYRYNIQDGYQEVDLAELHPGIQDERVAALAVSGSRLFIGLLGGGLYVSELDSKGHVNAITELSSDLDVIQILTSKFRDDVWIASYDNGLLRLSDSGLTSYRHTESLDTAPVTKLFQSKDGHLFAVGIDTLYILKPSSNEFNRVQLDFPKPLGNPSIYSIAEDANGAIWLGTRHHGLFKLSDLVSRNASEESYRSESLNRTTALTIYAIHFDSAGRIWASTHRGIALFDSAGKLSRLFGYSDGAQGNDFNYGASLKSSGGQIYFGGPRGFNVIEPDMITPDEKPPTVAITGISTNSSQLYELIFDDPGRGFKVPHRDYLTTFKYGITGEFARSSFSYRYRLENFEKDWIYAGDRNFATYTNLPSGDYTFHVQGASTAGIWDTDGARVGITVLPPPWRTPWAYALYLAVLSMAVWVAHRIYQSYAIERRAAEIAEEMQLAEQAADDSMQEQIEYQDEVIRSAYDHKLETLALVSWFEARPDEPVSANAGNFGLSGLQRRMYVLSRLEDFTFYGPVEPTSKLAEFTDAVFADLLKESGLDTTTVVTINDMPGGFTPTRVAFPVSVMLYELLHNCFSHAFDGSCPANYVFAEMTAEMIDEERRYKYTLCVRDSGVGTVDDPFALADTASGLAVVKAIVDLLEGSVSASNDPGLRVVIEFPEPLEREDF